MNNTTDIKNIQDEALIFNIAGFPTFLYLESEFWINLTSVWKHMGNIERIFLLSSEVRIFLNDPDAGTYARLDEFISISPRDVQAMLIEQKNKFIAMMKSGVA